MSLETKILNGGDRASIENVMDLKPVAPFRCGRHAWDRSCGRQNCHGQVVSSSPWSSCSRIIVASVADQEKS
ncbi:hypothetical protein Bca101_018324 [Brassica carinata]